jgi:hypothetical protein
MATQSRVGGTQHPTVGIHIETCGECLGLLKDDTEFGIVPCLKGPMGHDGQM